MTQEGQSDGLLKHLQNQVVALTLGLGELRIGPTFRAFLNKFPGIWGWSHSSQQDLSKKGN